MKKTTGSYTSYTQAVTDAKAGVQEAFTFLYESTYRDKRYIAQKYMHSEADVEDVLQDAYVKAWRNLDQLKEAEKFPAWLSLIVSSAALDALRKKKELPFSVLGKESDEGDAFEYEEEDWRAEYQPEHAYTDKETSELLRELLDALSEEQRFCMLMYYVEEHSVAEIAEIIGCSEGTVKSRLNYGRKNLRAKAADMEKKGYTLYSIPPVALLLYLLRMEAKAASFAIPAIDTAAAAATAKSGAAAGSASGASTTAGGTTSGAAGSAASGAGGTTAGAAASGAGGAGAAAATATATAAVAAKMAGISLGVKIAAAVLTVVVLGGTGFAVSRMLSSPQTSQNANESLTDLTEQAADLVAEMVSNLEQTGTDTAGEETGIADDAPAAGSGTDETDAAASEATAAADAGSTEPLPYEGWGGLYSGSKNGHYYYVWLEYYPNTSVGQARGTIRLLWEGNRPYATGDALLDDAPRGLYDGDVPLGYDIRPGWNGSESQWIVPNHGDASGKIFVFDTWMERETSLIYTGTSLLEQ